MEFMIVHAYVRKPPSIPIARGSASCQIGEHIRHSGRATFPQLHGTLPDLPYVSPHLYPLSYPLVRRCL